MKKYVSKYADPAKTLLAAIAMFLVTGGYYDAATAQMLVGIAMGIGTAFWQLYDLATTKRLVKETKVPVPLGSVNNKDNVIVNGSISADQIKPYATPNKVM